MIFARRERKSRPSSAEAERVLAEFLGVLARLAPFSRAKPVPPRAPAPEVR